MTSFSLSCFACAQFTKLNFGDSSADTSEPNEKVPRLTERIGELYSTLEKTHKDGEEHIKAAILQVLEMLDLSDPSFEPQDSLLLFLLQHSKPRVRVNALKVLMTLSTPRPSGRKWTEIGTSRPSQGHELRNQKLSEALEKKTDFSKEDMAGFDAKDLLWDNFIRSTFSGKYFRPAARLEPHIPVLIPMLVDKDSDVRRAAVETLAVEPFRPSGVRVEQRLQLKQYFPDLVQHLNDSDLNASRAAAAVLNSHLAYDHHDKQLLAQVLMVHQRSLAEEGAPAEEIAKPKTKDGEPYFHDFRLGQAPSNGATLTEVPEPSDDEGILPSEWQWSSDRRVGDTALQIPCDLYLQLRLPDSLWPPRKGNKPTPSTGLTLLVDLMVDLSQRAMGYSREILSDLVVVQPNGCLAFPAAEEVVQPARAGSGAMPALEESSVLQSMRWHRLVCVMDASREAEASAIMCAVHSRSEQLFYSWSRCSCVTIPCRVCLQLHRRPKGSYRERLDEAARLAASA